MTETSNIIKLINPLTGHVRSKEEIKADPECQRTYFTGDPERPSVVDPYIYALMQKRTKPHMSDATVIDSNPGYGKTLGAISAIAQASLSASKAAQSLLNFSKQLNEATRKISRFWLSPIEATYLQHHQHLPGRKGNARQRKKAFKKAEHWYYNVYLKCEVSQ